MRNIPFIIVAAFMIAQAVYAITPVTKPYTFVSGTKAEAGKVNANDDALLTGVNAAIGGLNQAAGTKATLDTRLDISLNEDGTFKNISGVTAGSQWLNPAFTFNYSSATKFNVSGDQTDIYLTYRRLKANLAASTGYSEVVSSVYNAGTGKTYITIADAVLTNPITSIEHSIISPVSSNNSAVSARVSTGYPLSTANTANSIVFRDASGNFSAGTITGNVTSANNSDTVDNFHASQTPIENQIPVLSSTGGLTIGSDDVIRKVGSYMHTGLGSAMIYTSTGDTFLAANTYLHSPSGNWRRLTTGYSLMLATSREDGKLKLYTAGTAANETEINWAGPHTIWHGGQTGTPASAGAACSAGDQLWDTNYHYICVATNTWKRSALSTW